MKTEHPITPRPELVAMWAGFSARHHSKGSVDYVLDLANKAARWGADQELEACCEWLVVGQWFAPDGECLKDLRAARRPKPPSLNDVALQMLSTIERDAHYLPEITDTIRRALEAQPE